MIRKEGRGAKDLKEHSDALRIHVSKLYVRGLRPRNALLEGHHRERVYTLRARSRCIVCGKFPARNIPVPAGKAAVSAAEAA